jgi:anti-sigma28 factor (negative regulator of flagellin synthesis)
MGAGGNGSKKNSRQIELLKRKRIELLKRQISAGKYLVANATLAKALFLSQ